MNRWRVVFRVAALGTLLVACQGRPGADARAAADEHNSATTVAGEIATTTTTNPVTGFSETTALAPAPLSANTGASDPAVSKPAPTGPKTDVATVPALYDADGHPLPQTEDKPTTTSPSLNQRLTLLVRAIAEDKPELALPSFFPVEAYTQVKAIEKPERDWKRRLVAAFERNIHEYHRQLGAKAAQVQLGRLEVPEAKIKWMKPGSEGNRVGYHRVVRSKLVLLEPAGRELPLEVTSLISWRGEWYVVHLHGFE